jgi:hypothetical protein
MGTLMRLRALFASIEVVAPQQFCYGTGCMCADIGTLVSQSRHSVRVYIRPGLRRVIGSPGV